MAKKIKREKTETKKERQRKRMRDKEKERQRKVFVKQCKTNFLLPMTEYIIKDIR